MGRDEVEPDIAAGSSADAAGNGSARTRRSRASTTTKDAGDLPDLQSSQGRSDWSTWPIYESAALGLPGSWWYPVTWSREIGSKPVGIKLLGRDIVFQREGDKVHALHDR